jgi:LmbE family N-acetylglucosaminyl deacetylase
LKTQTKEHDMLPNPLPNFGTLVGMFAHPDDFFYAAASTERNNRRRGNRVISVCATSGEAGSHDHNRWPPAHMARIREQEERNAQAHIGVEDIRFWALPDGELHLVPFEYGVQLVVDELVGISSQDPSGHPLTVITYGPDGLTGHSDHKVISAWTTEAFRRANVAGSRLLYVAAPPEWEDIRSHLERADAISDSGREVMPVKEPTIDHPVPAFFRGIKRFIIEIAYPSQSGPLADAIGGLHLLDPWFERETFVEALVAA